MTITSRLGLFQLTGNISGLKIGLVKEGFGHTGAESDVEELVRQAASCMQTHLLCQSQRGIHTDTFRR